MVGSGVGVRAPQYARKLHKFLRKRRTSRCFTKAAAGGERAEVNVCLLPGDGIGPEISEVATQVLREAAKNESVDVNFSEALMGGCAIDEAGDPLPDQTIQAAKSSDAVLLAAIGGPQWDDMPSAKKPEKGLLQIRAELGAFANLRPAILMPQLVDASPLKREVVEGSDVMVVRELTGGIYFGEPRGIRTGSSGLEEGFNTMMYSEWEIERIARVAFRCAQRRTGRVCSIDKANVLEVSQLWRRIVNRVGHSEFKDVELEHMYVDNAAMQLVQNPRQFDTVLAGNIFGDILSDEAAMITGSIGLLPSASVSEEGPGIFEPVHGSAPDIAGKDKANPLAMCLSAAMLMRHQVDQPEVAGRIEKAVSQALSDGFRTPDLQSGHDTRTVGCKEMGDVLLKRLS